MNKATIKNYMTSHPYTIGQEQTLATAHRMMREHKIRHLPVLHGGKLVGILSQRDLFLVETLKDVDPDVVTVQEAMTEDLMTTSPEDPLSSVVQEMAERKIGSAIVFEKGKIIGIFTTTDALQAFSRFLKS